MTSLMTSLWRHYADVITGDVITDTWRPTTQEHPLATTRLWRHPTTRERPPVSINCDVTSTLERPQAMLTHRDVTPTEATRLWHHIHPPQLVSAHQCPSLWRHTDSGAPTSDVNSRAPSHQPWRHTHRGNTIVTSHPPTTTREHPPASITSTVTSHRLWSTLPWRHTHRSLLVSTHQRPLHRHPQNQQTKKVFE